MTTIASLDFDALPGGASYSPVSPWSVANAAPLVTTSAAADGAQGVRFATTAAGSVRYDTGAAFTTARVLSFKFRLGTLPSENMFIATIFDTVSGATQGDIRLTTAGALQMRNGSSSAGSSTSNISLNTWYRVEWRIDPSVNQQTLRVYLDNSPTLWATVGPATWSSDIGSVLSFGPRNSATGGALLDYDSVIIADDWTGPWVGLPLTVDAGSDTTSEVGDNLILDSTVSGGTPPYVYAWTIESGTGSFDDDTIADPVYTPTNTGVHVLRCSVTDDDAATEFDEFNVTVTGRFAPSAVSGWTTLVGAASRLLALTDDDSGSYIETGPNPAGELLTITVPSLEPPVGDFTCLARLSLNLGSASVTPRLYRPNGSTLISTADLITPTNSEALYAIVFAASDIASASLDPEDDWATGLVVILSAEL